MTDRTTVGAALAAVARRLASAGIKDNPRLEARLLVGAAIDADTTQVFAYPERELGATESKRLEDLVSRREDREPMARILGTKEFWSLPFEVTADTLVPRPDTETVVEAVLDRFTDRDAVLDILDLGTGTGCLLLAILSEFPRARGVGLDISPGAVAVARRNAERLGLGERARFIEGGWDMDVGGPFDLVVSNPPYIPEADIDGLMPEVARFDPRRALAGGHDGLDAYREIAAILPERLAPGGTVFLEIGAGQDGEVNGILGGTVLQAIENRKDLSGITRCVGACRPAGTENPEKGVGNARPRD